MTFIANLNGDRVVSLDYSPEEWQELKRNYQDNTLVCNDEECLSPMIPKTYHSTGTQFFSHKNKGVLTCKYSQSESPEHLYLKKYVYETLKGIGLHPELEVTISEVNRRADVIVDNKVFEIQLSQQSIEDYEIRSQDYRDAQKQVYWIILDTRSRFLHTKATYPVVFLDGKPDLSPDYEPCIEMYDAFTDTPTTMSLDTWIRRILNYEYKWTKDCMAYPDQEHWCCINGACDIELERKKAEEAKRQELLQVVRKFFTVNWGFIVGATKEYSLGLKPQKALKLQIKKRYGKDIESLTSYELKDILKTIEFQRIENFIEWLYPNHRRYVKSHGGFWGLSRQARKACEYAKDLYNERLDRQTPSCACPDKYNTLGAFRRRNGVYVAYRFCKRCGSRSTECVAKNKFKLSVTRNAHEWVRDIVNFKKTDNQPWA